MTKIRIVGTSSHATKEDADAMFEALQVVCDRALNEPGCLHFELFRSTTDPLKLCLLELWDSKTNYDAHHRLQAERKKRGELPGWPGRVIEFYQHAIYDLAEGVWVPRDEADRCEAVMFV